MKKQVLFIQGGGDDGYHADAAMVDFLRSELGDNFEVKYPKLTSDDSLPDFGWTKQLVNILAEYKNDVVIVAHSFGASILLKYLSEHKASQSLIGIFLLATPFWDGDEDWQQGFKLKPDFADRLPDVPLHLYHCKDDEEVPFAQFEKYRKKIRAALFHECKSGGHQFDNKLTATASDIKTFVDSVDNNR